jgi:hypothetical protein
MLVSKFINNSISPRTNYKPQEMVFGSTGQGDFFLNLENYVPAHSTVRNRQQEIDDLSAEIKNMSAIATEFLTEHKLKTNEVLNKHKITKQFRKYDYVFVVDRTQVPGSTRPLKTRFHPSPYIVLSPKFTSSLLMRLADNFQAVYSNNDIKRYEHTSPMFRTLPTEVSKILLHDFRNLLESDLSTIAKFDPLSIPTGIQLFEDTEEIEEDDTVETMGLTDDSLPNDINEPLSQEPPEIIADDNEETPATDISADLQDIQTENTQIDENIADVYNPSSNTQDALDINGNSFDIDGNSDSDNEENKLEKSETETYSFRDRNKRKVRFQNFA